jgi:NMD protein affecting ribosome stability and mRNA decay
MKKYEYRCDRCLIIEEKWILHSDKPFNSVLCHKCGGLALRLPWPKSQKDVSEDFQKKQNNFD